jgi:hypothetical protein
MNEGAECLRENGDEAPIGEADRLRARARGAVGVVRNQGVDADDQMTSFAPSFSATEASRVLFSAPST